MQWGRRKKSSFQKKPEEKKKSANGSTQQIDWKFCGKKHVPDLHVPSALHMANSVTSVKKATILLRSGQEENSSVVIYMSIRI